MEQKEDIYYIKRVLEGKTEYFSALLDKYSHPLYSLIIQIVDSHEDAQELLQDVFLKAFSNLPKYRMECQFSTWMYRIAYNTAISATRRKKQEAILIEESVINNVPDNRADEILSKDVDEARIQHLQKAIDLLCEDEKAIITLFYYEEKSIKEVSDIFNITVTNAKTKLHRIRKKLYVLMNEM